MSVPARGVPSSSSDASMATVGLPPAGDAASLATSERHGGPGTSRTRFWDGNRACAEGALMAGLRFYAGYPITPSTEIAEYLSWRLPQEGGVFIQMEDEIASVAACIGASQGGMKSMTATSGPGFSLMQENIGLACMTEIPLVVVNVQRQGPSTGQPTRPSQGDLMQSIWGTHGDHPVIVVSPSSVQEMLTLTVRAFNLSERFRTPVILLTDEIVAHMREKLELPAEASVERWERRTPEVPAHRYVAYAETDDGVPAMASFGVDGYRYHVTGLFHDPHGFPTVAAPQIEAWMRRAFRKIEQHLDLISDWELTTPEQVFGPPDRGAALSAIAAYDTLLVSYGASARTAEASLKRSIERGLRACSLRLQTVWPLDEAFISALLACVSRTFVIEMNRGQMLREIARLASGRSKVQGVLRFDGEMVMPSTVLDAMLAAP